MSGTVHASDCALHNEPAYPAGPCDCGALSGKSFGIAGMTVADLIEELKALPPELEVWSYGVEVNGHTKGTPAKRPYIEERIGIARVVIDGGCV